MQEGAPLLRYRSRDHVIVSMGPVASGRTGPRIRCIGRTGDMLIVRGVNVFPSAICELVNEYQPEVSGMISVRPSRPGVQQLPPLRVLAETIEAEIRKRLIVTTKVELVPFNSLPRSDYKSRLVDYADATG